MFVKVTENAENVDEAVEIPVEPEGHILMSTLIAQFPGACGLKFKTEQSAWRGVRVVDEKLLPAGDDAWSDSLVYLVTFPKDSKRKGGDDLDVNSAKSRKIERKCVDLIVLGLPWKSTDEAVRTYFEQYGEVVLCEIKRDASNQSKGFGFVRYKEYQDQCNVLGKKHFIDGRWCDVKIPNSQEPETSRKIFVGRLSETITIKDLQDYFSAYGQVIDVYIPKPFRAFGFVTFVEADIAQGLCGESHIIKGCSVHVSKADPKDDEMMGGMPGGGGPPMMMGHPPHHYHNNHHHSNQFTHSNSYSNNLGGGKMGGGGGRPYGNNMGNGGNNGMPSRSQSFYGGGGGPPNNNNGNKYERGGGPRNNNNQMGNGQYGGGGNPKYGGGQGGRNKSNNKYIEPGDGVNGGRGGMNMMGEGMGGMMNPNGGMPPNGMPMNGMMNGSNGGVNPMGNNQPPMNPNMMPPNNGGGGGGVGNGGGQPNGAGGEQMNAMMNMFNPMMAAFLQQLATQSGGGNMPGGPQDGVNGAPGGGGPQPIMPNQMGMHGGPQQQQMWTQSSGNGGGPAPNAPVSTAPPHHHSGSRYKGEKNNY